MCVSGVPVDEAVKGSHEPGLARIFREVVAFEVVDEDVVLNIQDVADLPALVHTIGHVVLFRCRMGHDLSSRCSIFCPDSYIMVALDPKGEVASALHHRVVGLLIVCVPLHVADVLSQLAARDGQDQIDDVGDNEDGDGSAHRQEFLVACACDNHAGEEQNRAHKESNVQRRLLLDRLVGLLEGWVADVEEHSAKAIGDALIAGVEGVGRHGSAEVDGLQVLISRVIEGLVHLHHYNYLGNQ